MRPWFLRQRRSLHSRLEVESLEVRTLLSAGQFVPNEVLVQFKEGVAEADKAIVRSSVQTAQVQRVAAGHGDLEVLYGQSDVAATVARLNSNPLVAYAEPNWILTKQVISNDTRYVDGSLWGMEGDDLPSATGPAGTTNQYGSQAEKVWATGNIGSKNVIIGIIDEGIDFNHPDLATNIWVNPYDAVDGIDNDGNGYIDDIHGWDFYQNNNTVYDGSANNDTDAHGTHVAGTIGALGGNGIGVAGVNWNVTIISGKFLGPKNGSIADAIEAINYFTNLKKGPDKTLGTADDLNIVALNNSWGGGGYSQAMQDAITRAAQANILFIAAAGNGDFFGNAINTDVSPQYPAGYNTSAGAGYDSVIAVAAIDSAGNKASWSNYGATSVDIGAPGVGIWSTTPNNTYSSYSGTSMATPHVTGAVALYAAIHPGATALQIKNALLGAARSTPSLSGKTVTGGRLDLGFAAPAVPGITISPSAGLTTTEAGGAASFTVVLNTQPTAVVTIALSSSDTSEGTVLDSSLTFTSENWNVAQTVTVTGVDDLDVDGNQSYSVVTAAASLDLTYNGLNTANVSVTNLDNEVVNSVNDMYVWDILWTPKKVSNSRYDLGITVDVNRDRSSTGIANGIAEAGDVAAAGATVTISVYLDSNGNGTFGDTGDKIWTGSANTNSLGQATFNIQKAPAGNYKAVVTNLTHSIYDWKPTLDHENPDLFNYDGKVTGLEPALFVSPFDKTALHKSALDDAFALLVLSTRKKDGLPGMAIDPFEA